VVLDYLLLLAYARLACGLLKDLSQGSLDWLFCPSPGYTCLCLLFEISVSWSFYLLQFCVICWPSWAGLGCCSMQLGLLLYTALYAVCCSATQGTLHMPMGVQAADVIHCWNGFASLGTSSFTGVVFFVAAICSLKFSLIAYGIEDLLEYILDLQVLCRLLVMC